MADALFTQPLDHSRDSVLDSLAIEEIRVDQNTGLILCGKGCLLDILAAGNDLDDLTAELLSKLPVAVIVRRDSHDGTGCRSPSEHSRKRKSGSACRLPD